MRPPHYTAAIATALRSLDYPHAMSLALQASHSAPEDPLPGYANGQVEEILARRPSTVWAYHTECRQVRTASSPREVAQRIVATLREQQEGVLQLSSSLFPDVDGYEANSASFSSSRVDPVPFVASLARDWLQDLEAAVNLLCAGRHYALARDYALPSRPDLVQEVYATARSTMEEAIEAIQEMAREYPRYTQVLCELWAKPAERIAGLAGLDATLHAALHPEEGREEISDSASVFTAASQYSMASMQSRVAYSTTSRATGSSTVSILSQVSDRSTALSTSTATTSFSIQGLDHALLSRGTVSQSLDAQGQSLTPAGGKRVHKRDASERRQKRIERSKSKGLCRDLFNTKGEQEACEGLWRLARTLPLAIDLVTELCTVMLTSTTPSDYVLACQCQQAIQALVRSMQSSAPPYAPAYPQAWLEGRQMGCVRGFQSAEAMLREWVQSGREVNEKDVATLAEQAQGSWFRICAQGIQAWFDRRMSVLQSSSQCW